MAPPVVLFETRDAANGKKIGFATLNAERSLNALSFEMAQLLWERLHAWKDDPHIVCVVLQGAGDKAFCAGGDIVALYKFLLQGDDPAARAGIERYFVREYALDYLIHTFPKPVVCWGHGIAMGGGLGLMVGASHRVVTEKSRLAMPEIAIGLYPDVGASRFLRRMPGRVGLYVGLTGAPLNAADALFLKLADHYVSSGDNAELFAQLPQLDWTESDRDNRRALSELFERYRDRHALAASNVRRHLDLINEVTDYSRVDDVAAAIAQRAGDDPWLARNAAALQNGSPTSAKVIFEIYRRAAQLSLEQAFALELGLTIQFTRRPDLREGIRALLIDKDNRPRWSPPTLAQVSDELVAQHFVSPWPPRRHPFNDW